MVQYYSAIQHHDRRRRRSVIRLSPKRRKSISSFVLQRVAPSWRTITLLVVLFLGNNDHQNGAPFISFVRAKGFHHSSSSSSFSVTMDHPLLALKLQRQQQQIQLQQQQQQQILQQQQTTFHRWSTAATAAAAVAEMNPVNRSVVLSRVCAARGGATAAAGGAAAAAAATRTATHHHHHHHHYEISPTTTDHQQHSTATAATSNTNSNSNKNNNFTFSLFQPGDRSDVNPDGIPDRYMRMQNGNVDKARKALSNSLQFRQEHDIDSILSRPHVKFDQCKAVFPHYLLGRTPVSKTKDQQEQHVIFLQRPALVQLPLANQLNVTIDDLLMHYVYVFEYIWNILEGASNSNATMVSLIDLTGLDMGLLRRPELLKLVQRFVSMIDAHYPQRAHITMLLNAPKWFGGLYRIISPILRETTKAKIKILSNGQEQEDMLVHYLGHDIVYTVLPPELRKKQRHHHKKRKQQRRHRRGRNNNKKVAAAANEEEEEEKVEEVILTAAPATTTISNANPSEDTNKDSTPAHVAAFDGQSTPLEVELRNFCLARLEEAGKEMMPL